MSEQTIKEIERLANQLKSAVADYKKKLRASDDFDAAAGKFFSNKNKLKEIVKLLECNRIENAKEINWIMTQDFYHITFSSEGKEYKGRVFSSYEQERCYYQVHVEGFDHPLFIEAAVKDDVPVWQMKQVESPQPEVSDEFIYQLGNAIESHED